MDISSIYNPANQTEKELVESFAAREKEFNILFTDVKADTMLNPPQHYIIQGLKGTGKTTLLLRTYYEIKNDKKLNSWLLPIIFNEEQYNISTLYKLWENIAIYLEDYYKEFSGLFDKMDKMATEIDYETIFFELLQNSLTENKKKIVLFIDNFGDLLNKFNTKEQQRFREVLITCSDIRIIGSSVYVAEATYDYGKPFFDFFKIINLQGLNKKESERLLLKLDEVYKKGAIQKIIENNPGRIEALRRLTNGIPRTIVLLYQIFADDKNGDSFKDLETILDKVTPLYKHRMDDLSSQQQEITDVIAKNWDAISVKEIVAKPRMQSKAVSAQLKQLEKNRIISAKKTSTKNNLYQLTERFFNIWYLMRNSRKREQCKVRWLVRFLETWCSDEDLISRAKQHISILKTGNPYHKYAYHMSEAFAQSVKDTEVQDDIIKSTQEYLKSAKSEYYEDLSKSNIELAEDAQDYYNKNKFQETLSMLLKINKKNANHYYMIAWLYKSTNNIKKAEKYYLMAIRNNHIVAMNNLAILYQTNYKDYAKAEKLYLKAVENGYIDSLHNLGLLYDIELNDYKKAEKYYLMAIENGHTNAMNNLSWIYFKEKKNKSDALNYSEVAFENNNDINRALTYATILLWNDEIEKVISISKQFLENRNCYEEFLTDIELFVMLLIAKKQYNYTYKLFNVNKFELKDRLKPVYYSLMSLMQKDYPDEIKKMGDELKGTVEEILAKIKELEKDYS